MAKKTLDEILTAVKNIVGDKITTDEAITLVEDITDTMTQAGENWEQKYIDNDRAWRERYTSRFYSTKTPEDEGGEIEEMEEKTYKIEDLFKGKEDEK